MLKLQDLTDDFNKLDYYLCNSSEGFIVWECNENTTKIKIKNKLKKYKQTVFIDMLNYKQRRYSIFNKINDDLNQKKIFVFDNFAEVYNYSNFFDINSFLMEANFNRDILAKNEKIYIFIFPTFLINHIVKISPSFWSYISIHFYADNVVNSPLNLKLIRKNDVEIACNQKINYLYSEINSLVYDFIRFKDDTSKKEKICEKLEMMYEKNVGTYDPKYAKLLWILSYNLSRMKNINGKYEEALFYANKCIDFTSSKLIVKSDLNISYCRLNLGYRNITHLNQNNYSSDKEKYYFAVEHFVYGNINISKRIAEDRIIKNKKQGKYYFLFMELLAIIFYYDNNYKLALDMLMEILFMQNKIKDTYFIDLNVIKNNIDIVTKEMKII